jgi:hypothetical protein
METAHDMLNGPGGEIGKRKGLDIPAPSMSVWRQNRWLWRIVFVAAILYFLARGPWRAIYDSGDFLLVFTAARCWLHGMNPYSANDLAVTAQAAGLHVTAQHFITSPSVYMPSAFALLAPLALLPWNIAQTLWLACLVALSAWSIVLLARMAKGWELAAGSFLLAFAPLHTGLNKGQPSVLVCALICLSIFTPQPYAAGLILGLAAALKPQLALGFLLLALGYREYRKVITACVFGLVAIGVALIFMAPGWFPLLTSNLWETTGGSFGLSAPTPASWYQLVNIHILIPRALYGTPLEVIFYAIIVLITVFAAWQVSDYWMAATLIASATVLIGYHRFYDAEILWFGVPAMLFVRDKRFSLCLLAGYAVLLVPGQTMTALWLGTRSDNPWSWLLLRQDTLAILLVWATFAWIAVTRHGVSADQRRSRNRNSGEPISVAYEPKRSPSQLGSGSLGS